MQRSPRYWFEPSSTGARSFHSWTGPARSTYGKGRKARGLICFCGLCF
jgi:hypothetical protein